MAIVIRLKKREEIVRVRTAFDEFVVLLISPLPFVGPKGIPSKTSHLAFTVVVVYLAISTLNVQLEHANIKLNEPLDCLLRLVFVTPNMHKVHHSREQIETDTNYSNIFSVWDRIFGTYTSTIDFQRLRYGLDGFDDRRKQTMIALLRTPFAREAKY